MKLTFLLLKIILFGFTCKEEKQENITEETLQTKKVIFIPKEDINKIKKSNLDTVLYKDSLILVKQFSKPYPQVYNAKIALQTTINNWVVFDNVEDYN